MIYKGTEINKLEDNELINASFELATLIENYNLAKSDPKWIKKFKNRVDPTVNPSFTQLQQALADELKARGLSK